MTPSQIASWLDLLQHGCQNMQGSRLYFILDQAGSPVKFRDGLDAVLSPDAVHSLFTGLPEAHLIDHAPLLVGVNLSTFMQRQWLSLFLETINPNERVLALHSQWPFSDLADFLGPCLNATIGGASHLLRFYDPRIFPVLLSDVLDPPQQRRLLRPVAGWSWVDRDGIAQFLPGLAAPPAPDIDPGPFEITDAQMEIMGCVSDAHVALNSADGAWPGCSPEQAFQRCYAAMLEATRTGLIPTSQREDFALEQLRKGDRP